MKKQHFASAVILSAICIGPSFGSSISFTINSNSSLPISPLIYGANLLPSAPWDTITSNRAGGNRWTTYNWENNASNSGTDLKYADPSVLYQNDNYLVSTQPTNVQTIPGQAVLPYLQAGTASIVTIPMAGYVSADTNPLGDVTSDPNYLTSRYNQGRSTDPARTGPIPSTPNLTDDYVNQDEYVNWIKNNTPSGHTVLYSLDNEPDLWAEVHTDIHEAKTTYEEIINKTIEYASMVKTVNPDAIVLGPVSYGWNGYDTLQDASDADEINKLYPGSPVHFLDYYLDTLKQYETQYSKQLVDVLDLHYYTSAQALVGYDAKGDPIYEDVWSDNIDQPVIDARVQAARSLWDPTYTEDSWIAQYRTNGPIMLVPLINDHINEYNQGTKFLISEYNFGAAFHISGGIAQADALGAFGKTGLYGANYFPTSEKGDAFAQGAFAMFRNFDGQGSAFGDTSIDASTSNQTTTSIFASLDSTDPSKMILVALNKTGSSINATINLGQSNFTLAEVFQLTTNSLTDNIALPLFAGDFAVSGGSLVYTMPAYSVSTIQVSNGSSTKQALSGDLALESELPILRDNDLIYYGNISGSGSVSKSGLGTLTLAGEYTYTGGTVVKSGTLQVGSGAAAPSLAGNLEIATGAVGKVVLLGSSVYGGQVSGGGRLVVDQASQSSIQPKQNVLLLSGDNSYKGGTVINGGTLAAVSQHALGLGSVLLNNNSALSVGSNTIAGLSVAVGGDVTWGEGATIALVNGGTLAVEGALLGTPGNRKFDISKIGPGRNHTVVTFASSNFSTSDFQVDGGSQTKLEGMFEVIGNNKITYRIFSSISTGQTIDNEGRTPAFSDFIVEQATTVGTGATVINSIMFNGNNPLTISKTGIFSITSGQLNVVSGASVVSGGSLVTPGNFSKSGSGELDVQSNLVVNGTATVETGLLSVNGNLVASNVVVNQNATLGGAGTIYSNVNVSGGNLAPGNSPGTLTVAGNLVLTGANSTIIEIESPTNFDRIVVGGQATLGGALNIEAYGGNTFAYGQQYNFLQAGNITGNFASITAPETFRGRFLNSGTVGTILIAPDTYTRVAVTPNQVQVAKALDRFIPATSGDELLISTTLDLQTAEQYPAAFDQIMPGFYESLANIAIEQAFAQTQMLNQRISSVRLGAAGFQAIGGISQPLLHDKNGKSASDAKDASPIVESATATNWNTWALGTGMFSRSTNLGSLQNYNNDAGGFLVGADYRWSENFVTGLYGGYDYSYAEYNGGGSTKGNGFNFGTYASYAKDGYYADAVIGGGYTGFQTQRSIEFSTIDRTASADPNSGQFTAGLNLGKDFEVGKFTLGPIVGAQYTYAGIGSFTESGAESLDLSLGQQNANSLRSTLGGRIAYTWNVNQKIAVIPEVRMFWQHEFLNNPRNINASLDGGNGAAFDFETTDPYRNSVFAGAGITAQFGKNLSGSVFYNINFGSQTYQSNMVSAGLSLAF